MNIVRYSLAALTALALTVTTSAFAVDVPVSYLVDAVALKGAASGTDLTFELHDDAACTAADATTVIAIDDVTVSKLKLFKPSGGAKPPKAAELRVTIPGVTLTGHLYLEVTGTGISAVGGACQAQAAIGVILETCSDSISNQDESDIDCGGAICGQCPTGDSCNTNQDCVSEACTAGTCVVSCTDGIENQDETDLDCGGSCPGCLEGQDCLAAGDCSQSPVGLLCESGTCTTHCGDGLLNGDESDVDCGGFECENPCMQGQTCTIPIDCLSNVCVGVCAP